MIVVIIAGGSGTRLWPLSTPEYPKHLLKINGDNLSLLQRTYQRAQKLAEHVYIVSETGHIQYVKDQLSGLDNDNFIIEPGRRGTANCIIAALDHISKKHSSDEPISILSADHFIRDLGGFIDSFEIAANASVKYKKVVLVGAEPDYPATGFGYIQKEKSKSDNSYVYGVHSFKEKPNLDMAKTYLKSGKYLWNCGYFIGSVNTFIREMKDSAPDLYNNYLKLSNSSTDMYDQIYLGFENITIDYGLIEKIKDLLVVHASFDWMDLGSFGDMYKVVESDVNGNYIQGQVEIDGVENSYIQNNENKPIAVIGLDNIVVVNTRSGILVSRKDLSQKVGEVSKRFNK
ncbi:MAG TPA: sugar phosphate nucleotidyltransferase [Candidatus Saccharimonadales bacterium]